MVLAVAVQQWSFWQQPRLDTDVLALLPQDEQSLEVSIATHRLVEQASRQIVVLVGAPAWAQTKQAAMTWRQALPNGLGWHVVQPADPSALSAMTAFYAPWRDRLLTQAQRRWLEVTPVPIQTQSALMALIQPGAVRLTDWGADPLALWPQWWMARATETRARSREGESVVSQPGMEWMVLMFELDQSAMSLDGNALVGNALAKAAKAVRTALPEARLLHAGVPLHAEAAAVQAHSEINT
ncbi:MAG: hypothetical protein IBX54_11950, partial [Rhodoferax sp.]|nr:hypothetical protein [Rhodoferax sp.]